MKNHSRFYLAIIFAGALALPHAGAQGIVSVNGDRIVMTGCVTPSDPARMTPGSVLAWTRNDLLLSRAIVSGNPVGTAGTSTGGMLYYLDKNDDLRKHIGQYVEIKGKLKDIDKGHVKIDHKGDFTEVTLNLDDDEDKVRVPTSWFGTDVHDKKYDIIARKVEVDDVRVIGACPAQ